MQLEDVSDIAVRADIIAYHNDTDTDGDGSIDVLGFGVPAARMGNLNGDGVNDLIFVQPVSTNQFVINIVWGGALLPRYLTESRTFDVEEPIGEVDTDDGELIRGNRITINKALSHFNVQALYWDQDKYADILVASSTAGVDGYLFLGNVAGDNNDVHDCATLTEATDSESVIVIPCTANVSSALPVLGDINGDGLEDAAIAGASSDRVLVRYGGDKAPADPIVMDLASDRMFALGDIGRMGAEHAVLRDGYDELAIVADSSYSAIDSEIKIRYGSDCDPADFVNRSFEHGDLTGWTQSSDNEPGWASVGSEVTGTETWLDGTQPTGGTQLAYLCAESGDSPGKTDVFLSREFSAQAGEYLSFDYAYSTLPLFDGLCEAGVCFINVDTGELDPFLAYSLGDQHSWIHMGYPIKTSATYRVECFCRVYVTTTGSGGRAAALAVDNFRLDQWQTISRPLGPTQIGGETVEVTMTPVGGDFNGDSDPDLAVLEYVQLANDTPVTGRLHVFWSIADQAAELELADADLVIDSGDIFGTISNLATGTGMDLNADGITDILAGAAQVDVFSNGVLEDAGRVYAIYGSRETDSPPPEHELLTNFAVTGSGDFVAELPSGQPDTFDLVLTDDAAVEGQWYQFTTLGDGLPGNYLRVNPEPGQTRTLHAQQAGEYTPSSQDGDATPTAPTTEIGGTDRKQGIFEFDLSGLIHLIDDPQTLIEDAALQLDYTSTAAHFPTSFSSGDGKQAGVTLRSRAGQARRQR